MRFFLIALTMGITCLSSAKAYELCSRVDSVYLKGFGAFEWVTVRTKHRFEDLNPGFTGSLAAGYYFNSHLRGELELSYKREELKHFRASLERFSTMANGYYDFNFNSCVTPYIGLGIGATKFKSHSNDSRVKGIESDFELQSQAIVGIKTRITDRIDLGLEYRIVVPQRVMYDQDLGVALTYNF